MIHSEEPQVSAVLEASNVWIDNITGSITIGDMRIDDKGNVQFRDNSDNWTTVDINRPTISNIDCHGTTYAIEDNVSNYLDIEGLQYYDKKIKEYIDDRIDEKLKQFVEKDGKYKVMIGEG